MMKKIIISTVISAALLTSTNAEGDGVGNLANKGHQFYSVGQKFEISRWSLSSEGEQYATENCLELSFDYAYNIIDNHGFYVALELDRETYNPTNNDLDRVNLDYSVGLGYQGVYQINDQFAAIGRLNGVFGLDRNMYTQYNYETQMNEEVKSDGSIAGFEVAAGVFFQPFSQSALLGTGLAEFERYTINFDDRKIRYTDICFETRITASLGSCEDYFCKMDDDSGIPDFTANRHRQGNLSFGVSRLPYVGFGTERITYDDGNESNYNIFMAGFNASGDYFVADNIALTAGLALNGNSSTNQENESGSSYSDYRFNVGTRYYPFSGNLNNVSGYANLEVGQTKTENSGVEYSYKFGDNLIGVSIGVDYEHPVSEETTIYGRAGYQYMRNSPIDSDGSSISHNALEAEVGVRFYPKLNFSF